MAEPRVSVVPGCCLGGKCCCLWLLVVMWDQLREATMTELPQGSFSPCHQPAPSNHYHGCFPVGLLVVLRPS